VRGYPARPLKTSDGSLVVRGERRTTNEYRTDATARCVANPGRTSEDMRMSNHDPEAQASEPGSGLPFFLIGMALPIALLFGVAMTDAFGPVLATAVIAVSAALIYLGVQRSFGRAVRDPEQPGNEPST
jgi:hypothetical protein